MTHHGPEAGSTDPTGYCRTALRALNWRRQKLGISVDEFAGRVGWPAFELEAALYGALAVDALTVAQFAAELADLMQERDAA